MIDLDHDRVLLFDLDGVLIDSTSAVLRHWRAFALRHALDESDVLGRIHGRRAIDSVRELLAGHDEAQIRAAAHQHDQEELADETGIVALPGAGTLLGSLATSRWAVVTSAPHALATARLRVAGLPSPRVLLSADDVANGKPDPEGYLAAAARLGAEPERCVVFEDAPAGISAARAAGMQVVALTTTHTHEQLRSYVGLRDLVIGDLSFVQPFAEARPTRVTRSGCAR
ncbi:MAG: HAD family hydrolase [Solirubrobacteraceae bacterium]